MRQINVKNETSRLKTVVLGTAQSCGPTPTAEEAYDPKSLEHILAGTYPKEEDMIAEMNAFEAVLKKYNVEVLRPKLLKDCNQIFSRDIAFVIDDVFFRANILPDREEEYLAIQHIVDQINPEKVVELPEEAHIEGGDVMPWNNHIFIGTYTAENYSHHITARTNKLAVEQITKLFPNKTVKSFELRKSTNAKENALHLDCCFQPLGKNKAILHKNGFLVEEEYQWLVNFFGKENIFEITSDEMYQMFSNVFSISEEVIVSEKNFTRLNNWLREQGFTVEEIPYAEISKQEGLLRCSTLPLLRE
ncbi:dimethylarginine dimethylaminohydrolase family protein [Cellulophaga lytica]|uniref:arginine deiminase n=1 Tax=Cellulophaga lytica (strain ATCC 23178 / DSM 7489 / JCM 8516 / NBRC 14961 / NCIMB 1423 / VKM B-1433 / Cy l20) TaxID=867900 RepID=F0RF23_CELLC|nr:arginine deiminase family protein [Cellulophaga lytica]ADY29998.1 amidinotransferase [Cellulophaga lytica DSM 7489]AIM60992.1 cytochrome C biogenesis protein CcmF [Cellulophaga lytica]APU10858.1 amidinotransferase [Cellulophaga lytica]MDO6853482.1 arginine deiminase family protein [Cellulophaga lytica]WQG75838.1 arginine deiminase family protein [Cellulophaga lytica]